MPARSRPIGRPTIGPRVRFHLEEEVQQEVKRQADERGLTPSAMYRELVRAGLEARSLVEASA